MKEREKETSVKVIEKLIEDYCPRNKDKITPYIVELWNSGVSQLYIKTVLNIIRDNQGNIPDNIKVLVKKDPEYIRNSIYYSQWEYGMLNKNWIMPKYECPKGACLVVYKGWKMYEMSEEVMKQTFPLFALTNAIDTTMKGVKIIGGEFVKVTNNKPVWEFH